MGRGLLRHVALAITLATLAALLLATAPVGQADGLTDGVTSEEPKLGLLAAIDPLSLFPADDPILLDPANNEEASHSPPYLPPGGKFKLFGAAKDDRDPEPNDANEVFSFDTTDPAAIAGAIKLFGNSVKIDLLDDQVEVKYFYVGRTCGGGSTRIQLGISGDGDPKFNQFPGGPDQNAFGYLGDKPFGGACPAGIWVYEDMTNTVPKWDLTQFAAPCGFTCTWQQMETFLNTAFPNHRVLNEILVDDSHGFVATNQGCAYFDLLSAGARTFIRHDDTSNSGDAPNNC